MENEEYNPVEPNYYNYKGNGFLVSDLPSEVNNYNFIYACCYNVNNEGKYPFLRFLCTNSIINRKLNFPIVPVIKNFENCELINYTKVYLFGLFMLDDLQKFNNNINFNGFYEWNNNLYMFYNITECKLEINDIYSNNNLWLLLIDEIINEQKMCNIDIDYCVINFFIQNDAMCFLNDKNDNSYEIPIVGFVKKPLNKLNFTYTFGQIQSNKNEMLGGYYYFTNYINCFDIDNTTFEKDGIVRFALFTGAIKYIENYQCDKIDESEIKKQRLNDNNLNQQIERLTLRITDHDGKWCEYYDSVFLGNIELDNGEIFKNHMIVLKDYNQQIPLSYHFIKPSKSKEDYLII